MEDEDLRKKIDEVLGSLPENFNILEEQIDIDVQVEFFEISAKIKDDFDAKLVLKNKDWLLLNDISIEDKKRMLSQLSIIGDVEAYRIIEEYMEAPDDELRDWAVLAFQQSRMLLESSFLEEKQVFISTGMGGKDGKLRYFVVLQTKSEEAFTETQQKVVRNEFDYIFKLNDSEIEELSFSDELSILLTLIPLKVSLKTLFETTIKECNKYGDFVKPNFIITNVKKLTIEEVRAFLKQKKK